MLVRPGRESRDLKLASTALSPVVGIVLLSCLAIRPAFADFAPIAVILPIDLPPSWDVRDSFSADLTRDGEPELVLLVWRPWRDVPYMEWTAGPSPVDGFHDALGDSCHVILIDTDPDPAILASESVHRSYKATWAGSPLPIPPMRIAAADVEGDGFDELIVLEGDYSTGRDGPANRISVWRWNGFGFSQQWRSAQYDYATLNLDDGFSGEIIAQINRAAF
jgi:hypothetical protein